MPTFGNRSGGCHACRKMKVKCDEQRPQCGRCMKAGRQCPGYREELDNFRSMNKTTELKAEMSQKRRKSREPPPSPAASSQSEGKTTIRLRVDSEPLRPRGQSPRARSSSISTQRGYLAPPMSADWDTQAIYHFFDSFVVPADASRTQPGFLEYLPELYVESASDSYLIDATKAAAFMFLSKRSCLQSFAVQARRSYGKALMQASSNLNILEEAKSDKMAATLHLLCAYEVIGILSESNEANKLNVIRRYAVRSP